MEIDKNRYLYKNTVNFETELIFIENEEELVSYPKNKYSQILLISENKIKIKYENFLIKLNKILPFNQILIEDSDFNKTIHEKEKIENFLLSRNFENNCLIIGFGGGKICDLAGFIASTYLRGVNLMLIPTTLLSMVDASIGGKTAINVLNFGKNLVGSFYHPKFIIINLWLLETLEDDLIQDGMAEIIKMAILKDKEMFNILKENTTTSLKKNKKLLNDIVKRNIFHKLEIIQIDQLDKDLRRILNFGHTIGHAIESVESFNLSHGKSVSIGMVYEIELGIEMNLTGETCYLEIKNILENYNLPTNLPSNLDQFEIVEKINYDKKKENNSIKFVFVEEIGKAYKTTFPVSKEMILKLLSKRVRIIPPVSKSDSHKITEITLKGSKSICNRVLVLSALGKGKCQINNFLFCDDTLTMIKCLRKFGVCIEILSNSSISVTGIDRDDLKDLNITLNVENSGTTARFLISFARLTKNSIIKFEGSQRMTERPQKDLLDCLIKDENLNLEFLGNQNFLPFIIKTKAGSKIDTVIRLSTNISSQFATSILLSLPHEEGKTTLIIENNGVKSKPVSFQYISMTLKILEYWGIETIWNDDFTEITVLGKKFENPKEFYVEPDASTVNFYISYVALHGGTLKINGIGKNSIQGDSQFVDILAKLGYISEKEENRIIFKSTSKEKYNKIDFFEEDISICTDSFIALGIILSQHSGIFKLFGLKNQSMKECSRLTEFCLNLNKFGVFCYSFEDGIVIDTSYKNQSIYNLIEIKSCEDHRISMAFVILASYLYKFNVYLDNKNSVNKTYPEFFKEFNKHFNIDFTYPEFNLSKTNFRMNLKNNLNSPIFLIGMRNSGKTTLGKLASKKLGLKFLDLDEELLRRNQDKYKNIKEIIENEGWEGFRTREKELFLEIFQNSFDYSNTIIATGGGLVENNEILECLKSQELVVFIDTDIEFIKIVDKFKQMKDNSQEKPKFNKSIEDTYISRIDKYYNACNFIFRFPKSVNEIEIEGNFEEIIDRVSNNLADFISMNCMQMKFPLTHDYSFVTGLIVNENFQDFFKWDKRNLFSDFSQKYSCFEIRIDYFFEKNLKYKSVNEKIRAIINIISQVKFYIQIPVILTLRTNLEGGLYEIQNKNFKEYNEIIWNLTQYGIEYFDLEFHTENLDFLQKIINKEKNSRIILSKHFKNQTFDEVKRDVYNMSNLSIDILKIITNFDSNEYKNEFKVFLDKFIRNKPIIHFQMGEKDSYTRLTNTFMNYVYESKLSGPFAKGQMTRDDIISIREKLNYETTKRNYFVIGNNVSSSFSPFIHSHAFNNNNKALNRNLEFSHLNLENDIQIRNHLFFEKNFIENASITMPFKEVIFQTFINNASIECKYLASANTLKKIKNACFIYNTDFLATLEILLEIISKTKKNDYKILILGAGGASLGVILAIKLLNFSNVFIFNRTQEKAEKLGKKFNLKIYCETVDSNNFDIIISTLPSKFDDSIKCLIPKFCQKENYYVDLAYSKNGTDFEKIVKSFSVNYSSGFTFLIKQAIYQSEIFLGKRINRIELEEAYYNHIELNKI